MIVHSSEAPEVECFVLDSGPRERRLPPTDLPPGFHTLCADCGGPYRCHGCPRPEQPRTFASTIDTAETGTGLGGPFHAIKQFFNKAFNR